MNWIRAIIIGANLLIAAALCIPAGGVLLVVLEAIVTEGRR